MEDRVNGKGIRRGGLGGIRGRILAVWDGGGLHPGLDMEMEMDMDMDMDMDTGSKMKDWRKEDKHRWAFQVGRPPHRLVVAGWDDSSTEAAIGPWPWCVGRMLSFPTRSSRAEPWKQG